MENDLTYDVSLHPDETTVDGLRRWGYLCQDGGVHSNDDLWIKLCSVPGMCS